MPVMNSTTQIAENVWKKMAYLHYFKNISREGNKLKHKTLFLVACFLGFILCGSVICSGNPLDQWTLRHLETSGALGDSVYGNDRFVAVGHDPVGTILFSLDGASWYTAHSDSASLLSGLAFGEGLFIATGSGGEILSSSNGSEWTRRGESVTSVTLSCAVYGNGIFVAAGSGNKAVVSTNGIDWIEHDMGGTASWFFGIDYFNNHFVAVGRDGVIMTSADGEIWVERASGTNLDLSSVSHSSDKLIAVGKDGLILSSSNGSSWTKIASGVSHDLAGIHYNYGRFVVVGKTGLILSSNNAVAWVKNNSRTTKDLVAVTSGQHHFVTVGENRSIYQSARIPMNILLMMAPINTAISIKSKNINY